MNSRELSYMPHLAEAVEKIAAAQRELLEAEAAVGHAVEASARTTYFPQIHLPLTEAKRALEIVRTAIAAAAGIIEVR